ncbi:MAG: trigger factor [Deltaproteobacteria bacterium]|nr:trigger factor [Deltaproteobacteria bacterium]
MTEQESAEQIGEIALQMSVTVERTSDVERRVAVEIPWDEVSTRLEEAYRELGQGVTVKGFRKGKVPRRMLEQLFGKHVNSEVAQRLRHDSISKALTDNELAPVSEPQFEDDGIVDGDAFRYAAVLQVVPEVEPKDYFGVTVKQRPAKTSDEAIERSLEGKRRQFTEYLPIEGRNTAPGDVITVDILGKIGDRPLSLDNQRVELDASSPIEPLPGLAAKLTGISLEEEELDIKLTLPAHHHDHDHEHGEDCDHDHDHGEEARLLVTIKDARQKVVPELDDDFAKDTGEAESLAELREVLRKELLEADEKRAVEEAKSALVKELLKINEVPVVPALVDRHLERMISMQLAMFGIDRRTAGIDEEALKDRARGDAEETVQSMLLIEAIAKAEKVEVTDADITAKLEEIAEQRGQAVAKVRAEYEKEGRLLGIRAALREEKTLDLLMSKANIVVEEPSDNAEESDNTEADAES